jgi:RHS repeat-associated protein
VRAATAGEHGVEGTRRAKRDGRARDYTEGGATPEHVQYFAFGETWVEEHKNTEKLPYLFTSKELDEETGLYYFGARYYDPRTSVWQSADPNIVNIAVLSPANLNLYGYSIQNPVRLKDPNGRDWKDVVRGFVAAVADANTGNVAHDKLYRKGVDTASNRKDYLAGYTSGSATAVVQGVAEIFYAVTGGVAGEGVAPELTKEDVAAAGTVIRHGAAVAVSGHLHLAEALQQVYAKTRTTSTTGGGKTGRKLSKSQREIGQQRVDEAKTRVDELRSKPNKTPADKEELERAERGLKKARDDLKKSETHAKRSQKPTRD